MSKKGTSRSKRNALCPRYCEIPGCGYDVVVQKHRIIPGRDRGKYALGNVIALCPTHHAEADRTLEGYIKEGQEGYLPASTLKEIVDKRIQQDAAKKFIEARTGSSGPIPWWIGFTEEPVFGYSYCFASDAGYFPSFSGRGHIASSEEVEHRESGQSTGLALIFSC